MFAITLNASDGRTWIASWLSRTDSALGVPQGSATSLGTPAGHSGDAFVLLDTSLEAAFMESEEALWRDLPEGESTFIVLLARCEPPEVDPFYGDPATSFVCTPDVLHKYVELNIDCWPQTNLYAMLKAIANGVISVDRLLVRQIPDRSERKPAAAALPKALLMPHRGEPKYLKTALNFISKTAGNSLSVNVGLDVDDVENYREFITERAGVNFFRAEPAPVGPYVIRQELAERAVEPLLCLQDSDDISCHDRFTVLSDALARTGSGIVGSHELCFDEIRVMVYPVWYPVESSASLAQCHNHALLHATLMARRSAFFECGGLSTHNIVANDTQFMLRAYFSTEIRNVDEFVYIRRRHPVSLTNSPETVHGNPMRRALNAQWTADFDAIKRGEITLEESSLRPMRRTQPYRFERLAAENQLEPLASASTESPKLSAIP